MVVVDAVTTVEVAEEAGMAVTMVTKLGCGDVTEGRTPCEKEKTNVN